MAGAGAGVASWVGDFLRKKLNMDFLGMSVHSMKPGFQLPVGAWGATLRCG
jgi:hypothetical protein